MKRAVFAIVATTLVLGLAAPASAGTLTVGVGSTFDLGTGSLALGCADLAVTGTLHGRNGGLQRRARRRHQPRRHRERELRPALALRQLG